MGRDWREDDKPGGVHSALLRLRREIRNPGSQHDVIVLQRHIPSILRVSPPSGVHSTDPREQA